MLREADCPLASVTAGVWSLVCAAWYGLCVSSMTEPRGEAQVPPWDPLPPPARGGPHGKEESPWSGPGRNICLPRERVPPEAPGVPAGPKCTQTSMNPKAGKRPLRVCPSLVTASKGAAR